MKGEFRSADLKDYLGLPPDRTLLLSTAGPDPFMETLWDRGDRLDFSAYNIDLWFPAQLSTWDADGRAFQLFNLKRQLIHAVLSRSQFAWFRLGAYIPLSFLAPIRRCPNIVISCQRMMTTAARALLRREIQIAHKWLPASARLFFIARAGVELPSDREVYSVNSRWLMLALKGRTINDQANSRKSVGDLLVQNLKTTLDTFGQRRNAA
ncbi:MAG TPA: hypothetical protein VHQ90_13765 [Thermoanaerobaculia bacterium]|nr:hypothetical protein [Thermoanaerobaculia bacterium]